ncbi:type II toxin-antitoxin system RelE/ParE family toxin [Gloeobacter morelensis]|uniref:Type II toxin-antitoxin system RelE/ParE family toxin n=1 Tax=Gloeobacter morelensis MG652769 TaxID=2781736 RepID=A0ABY3PRW8_9CYAN|nr:type II toxin-antitoxin system RelE/ParE family toxin [Gloeobacter morelensis]UFP96370.1 type II toxin-antitoxin system RelE/ParE family toxin [Gloeobacter morelensis MG652769]
MESQPLKILWRRRAIADLARLREALPSEIRLRIVERIERSVQQLAQFPLSGRPGRIGGTRELVVTQTQFVVAYLVGEHIEILAVIHGSQIWPENLR